MKTSLLSVHEYAGSKREGCYGSFKELVRNYESGLPAGENGVANVGLVMFSPEKQLTQN